MAIKLKTMAMGEIEKESNGTWNNQTFETGEGNCKGNYEKNGEREITKFDIEMYALEFYNSTVSSIRNGFFLCG